MSKAKLYWLDTETGLVHGQEWRDTCLPENAHLVPGYFLPYPNDPEVAHLRDRIWPGRKVRSSAGKQRVLVGSPPHRASSGKWVLAHTDGAVWLDAIIWPEDQPKRVTLTREQIRETLDRHLTQGRTYDSIADAIFAAGEEVDDVD